MVSTIKQVRKILFYLPDDKPVTLMIDTVKITGTALTVRLLLSKYIPQDITAIVDEDWINPQ